MIHEDAEKLCAGVLTDTEALVDNALRILNPDSASPVSLSGMLTFFVDNTTPLSRQHVVRMPLGEEGISFGNVLLQTTGDGKKRYVRRSSWKAVRTVDLSCPARLAPRTSLVRRAL